MCTLDHAAILANVIYLRTLKSNIFNLTTMITLDRMQQTGFVSEDSQPTASGNTLENPYVVSCCYTACIPVNKHSRAEYRAVMDRIGPSSDQPTISGSGLAWMFQ